MQVGQGSISDFVVINIDGTRQAYDEDEKSGNQTYPKVDVVKEFSDPGPVAVFCCLHDESA